MSAPTSRRQPRVVREVLANDPVDTDDGVSRLSARDLRRELLNDGVDLERYGEEAHALRLRSHPGSRAIVARGTTRRPFGWGRTAAWVGMFVGALVALARRVGPIQGARDRGSKPGTHRSRAAGEADGARSEVPRAGVHAGATDRNV